MARIGEMPSTDDISATGYVIYTKDGVHANKITVEDFANALDILMTQELDSSGSGGDGGGLKYWTEYQDSAGNSFLLAQDPSEHVLYPEIPTLTADNWTSLYQYDNWESQEPIPNLPDTVENKTDGDPTTYYPYILFAMLHPIGSDLSDFTYVEDDIWKIQTDTIGKYKLTLFYLRAQMGEDGVYIWNNNLDYDASPVNDDVHDAHIPFNAIAEDYVGGIFNDYEDAANYLDSVFESSGTGMGVSIAGYYKWKWIIDNIYEHLADTEYGDEDTYTYISVTFTPADSKICFSEGGLDYIEYTEVNSDQQYQYPTSKEWANLFMDILYVNKVGDYTAVSNRGIYFGIPFSREQFNETTGQLDLSSAKAKYGPDGIIIPYTNSGTEDDDIIKLDYIDDRQYKEYVAEYIRDHLGTITYLTNVRINSSSVVDSTNQDVNLYTGQGLSFDSQTKTLSIDTSQLQGALQPGEGVTIENNTISFDGQVQDVLVDYQSVLNEYGQAEIWLPSGLRETRLQDGDHTQVEKTYEGSNYDIYQINVVDVKNNILEAADDVDFGDISTGVYTDNTSQIVVPINIPANTKGMLYGTAIINNNLITNDGYFGSMIVGTMSTWPSNDGDIFSNPMYDSKPIIPPYQDSGVNVYTQTVLKTAGYISNNTDSPVVYKLLVKIHGDKATTVYGKLTYVQNIDI